LYNVTEFYPRYVYPNMSQTSGIICPLSWLYNYYF
jgi:hypothetical protein